MRTWLAIWQCSALLGAVAAHADPSAKPTGRLRLPARFGDCKGCTVVAEPKTLSSHDDWVTVTVTGVQFGQPSDWVGVFAPKDISPEGALLRFPVRWQLAGTTCAPRGSTAAAALRAPPSCAGEACCAPNGYATTGNATLRFQLVNLRTSFVFALVQGTAQFPLLVARSGLVAFAAGWSPTGVHLALTAASDEMRVSWAAPAAASPAAVRWGTAPGAFAFAAAAASAHYNASDLCAVGGSAGGPAATLGFRDPGALNSAVMRGLAPATRYWYSVGSDVGGWSHDRANFSFATSAAAAAPAAPTAATAAAAAAAPPATTTAATGVRGRSARIFAFGDMGKAPSAWDGSLEHSWDNAGAGELGSWNVSRLLAAEAARAAPDFVLHIGDIAYAVGYLSEWDEFMAQIEPVAAAVPWMTGIGNHERNCFCATPPASALAAGITWLNGSDSGGECGVPYRARFTMPQRAPDEPWYSFSRGPVAVVVMSTEHDFSAGSVQHEALGRLLRAVDREATPWLIFAGHRPMYVDSTYFCPSRAPLQALIEPLLLEHGVDLALWGHHHSYHRSCPMRANATCVASGSGEHGVVHAVIGAAGYTFSLVAQGADAPAWVAFANDTQYGFATIEASDTDLHFQFLRADDGSAMDEFALTKPASAARRGGTVTATPAHEL